jgi:hypothetical protein
MITASISAASTVTAPSTIAAATAVTAAAVTGPAVAAACTVGAAVPSSTLRVRPAIIRVTMAVPTVGAAAAIGKERVVSAVAAVGRSSVGLGGSPGGSTKRQEQKRAQDTDDQ